MVAPARRRLDTDDAAGSQVDDRLVFHEHPVGPQRPLQRRRHRPQMAHQQEQRDGQQEEAAACAERQQHRAGLADLGHDALGRKNDEADVVAAGRRTCRYEALAIEGRSPAARVQFLEPPAIEAASAQDDRPAMT